jgi:5-methylcytosine-specific restriction protein A
MGVAQNLWGVGQNLCRGQRARPRLVEFLLPQNSSFCLSGLEMPEMPRRSCAGGCGRLVERGHCAVCAARGLGEQGRKSSRERGYGPTWQKASKLYLLAHPFCTDPYRRHGTILVLADEVDHIIPHKGDMKLFWDRTNWQGLCKSDHSRKTASEGGFGNSSRW